MKSELILFEMNGNYVSVDDCGCWMKMMIVCCSIDLHSMIGHEHCLIVIHFRETLKMENGNMHTFEKRRSIRVYMTASAGCIHTCL